MSPEAFAALLVARGFKVRKEGPGFRSQCPAHGGEDWNMTIRPHAEGGVVCTCHSHHCTRQAIAEAVGLTMTELVAEDARKAQREKAPDPRRFPYRDEAGTRLYDVVRIEAADSKSGKKEFWMRLPDAESGGVGDVRRVLFGLPELLLTRPGDLVGIAEGEKCALAVACLGIAATTNPNGAGKWRPEYTAWLQEHLPDRRFLVLGDNDEEGKKHAVHVGDSLKAAGLEVYLAKLDGLPAKGDVVQWIAAGGTAEKLQAMAVPKALDRHAAEREKEKQVISAPDLLRKVFDPLHWAVPGIIPEGLNILAGGPKTGKSWLAMHLALAVASGGKLFGQIPTVQGGVLYLALEDSQRRLKDRLQKLLMDETPPANLHLVTHWDVLGDGFSERLEGWLSEHPDCRLVIVDVFQRVRPRTRDKSKTEYQDDSDVMEQLQQIPRDHRVAMVIIHHTRKMTAADPFDMVSGSQGVTGGADSILVLMRQRDQKDATLHAISREADFDAMALEWDSLLCCWKLLGKAADHKLSAERKLVLEFLRTAQMDFGPADIAGALGMQPGAVRYLLGQMVQDGQITKSHYGKYCMTAMQKVSQVGPHTPHTPHTPASPHTPSSPHSPDTDEEEYEPGAEV